MSQPPPFRSPLSSPDPTTSSTSQFSPPRNIHLGSPTTPTYPLSRTASPTPLLPPSQPQSHSQSLSISTAPSTFSGTSHSGCVLCGLVATAARQSGAADADGDVAGPSRGTSSGRREVVYHDADITIYPAVGKERLCEGGKHLVVVVNRHLESVYDFGAADIPLLSHMIQTSSQLLSSHSSSSTDTERANDLHSEMRIGFVGTMARDPQSPHSHLHAHAMLGPISTSLPGAGFWRRNVVFGSVNWWGVEDLRAEIRESISNNRIKSGYSDRGRSPIDKVPDAGSVIGLPNALEPDPYSDHTPRPTSPGSGPSTTAKIDSPERTVSAASDETVRASFGMERGMSAEGSGSQNRGGKEEAQDEGYYEVELGEGSGASGITGYR